MLNEVYEFLKKIKVSCNEKIIVAVSYGPDSMVLLDILKNKYGSLNVICAHVHHNLRKESDDEAINLKNYCDINNIKFEMMKIEKYANNKFSEVEAREKRYHFFEQLIKKYNSKYLFTAHHGDDLVETILMRLVRGSSISGYCGIPLISKRSFYSVIRPLLFITKEDILTYCSNNKISYAVDKSNDSDKYTRNRYRKYVLPVLKEENSGVHKQFIKFSTVLQEYDNYFINLTDKLYDKVVDNFCINLVGLLKYDDLIIKRIIMKFLFEYYGEEIKKISDANVNNVLDLIRSSKPNSSVSLPNNKNLIKSYNKLFFADKKGYNGYCFIFEDYVSLPNNYCIKLVDSLENTTNYMTALDSSSIKLPIYVRNKLDGDVIEILGLNGKKKIKSIFINEKVPKERRNIYPIMVDSNGEVLWIPGIKKSKYDRSKQGKYDIILKYQKEENND